MIKRKFNLPSFLISALSGTRPVQLTYSEIKDTNISSTSSFIYDPAGSPLKSSQQLNVDWSKFENHTFFMSAEAKVNIAFDQIINGFPFDGTRSETEQFFEKLTGFDKWVFDNFPKYRGELIFSGTKIGEDNDGTKGSWIAVKDAAGSLFPELAKRSSGESVLNPNNTSMTIEMHLHLPQISNDTQFIIQKISGSTEGFSLYLLPSTSSLQCDASFSVVSGAFSITTTATLNKGIFNHIAVTLNREEGTNYLQFFKSGELVDVSRSNYVINKLNINSSDFLIGSGSKITLGSTVVSASQTFSGTLDELRVFHSARTTTQLQQYARKSIFSTDDLKLYYKFNEPNALLGTTISDAVNGIVIDSSGNSLHAIINNFTGTLRKDAGTDPLSRLIYEKDNMCPILFPMHSGVINLNTTLLTSASEYDIANPNLITKLVPQHYFLQGAAFEGFDEIEGTLGDAYQGSGIPGQGKKGNTQLLLSFLYIYAKFYDELKLFVDSFSTLNYVNYDQTDTIPDNFLNKLSDEYGFNLPPLFNDSTLEQYIRAENIVNADITVSDYPIKDVQNQLLRRVLVNMPDVLRSKGTQHSIKSFLRAIGIDPDNSMRIREFGGPTTKQLSFSRETKREPNVMAKFVTSSYVITPYLSSSRTEPGTPQPRGTFVLKNIFPPHGISNQKSDGLLTSGSWTVESIVKWTPAQIKLMTSATQSLCRMIVTGSTSDAQGLVANLLAVSSSVEPKLILYVRPGTNSTAPLLTLPLTLPTVDGLFNSDRWNVSFGCIRNDQIGSVVSSSYFLRAARQNDGKIEYYKSTSSYFYEIVSGTNVFRDFDATTSTSGTLIALGEGLAVNSGVTSSFLNNTSVVPSEARVSSFTGLISKLRFWSKALTEIEWKEHVRNYKSTGVVNPLTNYNFSKTNSGSFERLRMDTISKQEIRAASGSNSSITFLDFSLNGMHLTGSGFAIGTDTLVGELYDYSYLSPYFDEASSNEKIRSRGFLNQDIVNDTPWASVSPVYEIVKSEEPTDDVRFAIDFSLVDALNRDIITMFSTFDSIDNALGAPELIFSQDYPDLERLRTIYFNRISSKLNFKAFFEFYRWFDMSISTFINQLIPRKTNFKGTNFIIESHMLERHKLEYLSNEIYLADQDRSRIRDVLLLQQIVASVRKY